MGNDGKLGFQGLADFREINISMNFPSIPRDRSMILTAEVVNPDTVRIWSINSLPISETTKDPFSSMGLP